MLARYVTASAMGQYNEIDLDNKYIVLDTSGMLNDLLLSDIFGATDVANDLIMDVGGKYGKGILDSSRIKLVIQMEEQEARLIPDDDQYTLALLSTKSELDVCHITLLDIADAADFFAYHSGDYAVSDFYGGGWGY